MEYCPTLHTVHDAAPPGQNVPAGQAFSEHDVEPAGQKKPGVQGPSHPDAVRPQVSPQSPALCTTGPKQQVAAVDERARLALQP